MLPKKTEEISSVVKEELNEKTEEQAKNEKLKKVEETEGKKIIEKFFQPRKTEIEVIKEELEDKEPVKEMKVVPYRKEIVELKRKISYPKKEPPRYQRIRSFDNLERVKKKITKTKEELAREGFGGAKL